MRAEGRGGVPHTADGRRERQIVAATATVLFVTVLAADRSWWWDPDHCCAQQREPAVEEYGFHECRSVISR
jgi:hypothetical protein